MNAAARLKHLRRDEDRGFALVFVLFVTTMIMIAVTTTLTVTTPNITAAKQTQDVAGAMVAAQSGIDDSIAYLSSVPECRSQTRICALALDASTDKLAAAKTPRPTTLEPGQTFSWFTDKTVTDDGYVRVTSTGTEDGVSRRLVADLSLAPSILSYGYYSDYEALSPAFLRAYFKPRSIYLDDSNACSAASVSCSSTNVRYLNWKGPTNPDVCGQHWYADGSGPGRAAAMPANGDPPVTEAGTYGTTNSASSGTAISRTVKIGCDLVFSSSMVENGKTFTRDAILSSGTGPKFNQPVYTMWGYNDGTKNYGNPAFNPAGQKYRLSQNSTAMSNTPYLPEVAKDDLTLPKSIGTDGIPANACVFTGPTRVKLNGDGTATVTSPLTRAKNAASPTDCYPSNVSAGVVGWTYNYDNVGAGAIVTRNIGTVPSTGWPTNPTRSTNAPAANNEIFYFNAPGSTDVTAPADTSTSSSSSCSSTVKYSATVNAGCAWTTVGVTTEGSGATGWTSYGKTTCGQATSTNRQLFECEYANLSSSSSPAVAQTTGQYKALRDAVQTDLNGSTCLTGAASAQATCVSSLLTNRLKVANTGGTVSGSATSGAHRYVVSTSVGTAVTTTTATGTTGKGPAGTTGDPFFTQPTPATVTLVRTPLTSTVTRQIYSSSKWVNDAVAFTMTTTQSDYTHTAARGMTYFPNEQDVTAYNTGTDSTGTTTRGTAQSPMAGDRQPGDLYIDGVNKGKLSVLADNDVIVTGNITNPPNYTPDSDAVSIAAGVNVRNYHPVSCTDQSTDAINNTATGWCPNDVSGRSTSTAYTSNEYANINATGDRVIQAAVFALSGSFSTDNYNRAPAVGDLNIQGGLYQSRRGGNGVVSGSTELNGTTLQYTYVDLQRAELPYVPPASDSANPRPWNVVSVSAGN